MQCGSLARCRDPGLFLSSKASALCWLTVAVLLINPALDELKSSLVVLSLLLCTYLTGCFSMRPGDEITKKVKQNFGLILLSNG